MALVNCLFLANDSDSFTATRCIWFHYVHVLKIARLTVNYPALVVLWEDVSRRRDIECFPVQTTHPLHISPHIVFPADGPRACKMIYVLLSVDIPQSSLPEESRPNYIPGRTRDMPESSHLQGIDDTIVGMRAV